MYGFREFLRNPVFWGVFGGLLILLGVLFLLGKVGMISTPKWKSFTPEIQKKYTVKKGIGAIVCGAVIVVCAFVKGANPRFAKILLLSAVILYVIFLIVESIRLNRREDI